MSAFSQKPKRRITDLSLRSKILLGLALPLLIFLPVTYSIYNSTLTLIDSNAWVEHTHYAIAQARDLQKQILDLETGTRGFLITGKEIFLEPYYSAEKTWLKHIEELKILVSDNPRQVAIIDNIHQLKLKWDQTSSHQAIELRRQVSQGQASMAQVIEFVEKETGKNIVDAIRHQVNDFVQHEQELIKKRSADSLQAQNRTMNQILWAGLLIVVMTFIGVWWLSRSILSPVSSLLRTTQRISQGHYQEQAPVISHDEIGELAASFNTMTHNLKSSHDHLNAANLKLEQHAQELQASNQYKSDFLACMSHEIRTPMNGVIGMLQLLNKEPLQEDQQHKLMLALTSAQSLLVVINDILDFSKIEANKLDIESIPFDVWQELSQLSEAMAMAAQEKGLEFILDIHAVPSTMVKGDPARLRQVLTNLVSNAIKFTEQGEVIIRAELTQPPHSQQGTLSCTVIDTGKGIANAKLEHIFDSFAQEDSSITRDYGGTGLGLAIAKNLSQLMGGDIEVSSQLGQGSEFRVSIALQALSPQAVPHFDNLQALVVEPNDAAAQALQAQLHCWGISSQHARSAQQALTLLQPDSNVLFINQQLSDDQPHELLAQLKAHHARLHHPSAAMHCILMTVMSHTPNQQQLQSQGFQSALAKPINPPALLHLLQHINHVSASQKPSQHPAEQHSFSPASRILVVEDNHINQLVIAGLLEDLGLSCEFAGNGQMALHTLSQASHPYDLIFMDCQMPVMDGFSCTQAIRQGQGGEAHQATAIIALTANAMVGDKERCLNAGMNDYLAKPLQHSELIQVLQAFL